jgi:hypothetical protein
MPMITLREDPIVLPESAEGEAGSDPVRHGSEERRPRDDAEVDPALRRDGRGADAGGREGRLPRSVAHGVKRSSEI